MEKNEGNELIPSKLTFEDLKKVNQYGTEYWSARDLQSSLGYSQWRRFENAIQKAIESCKQSGNDPTITLPAPANRSNSGKELFKLLKIIFFRVSLAISSLKMEILESQKLPILRSILRFKLVAKN